MRCIGAAAGSSLTCSTPTIFDPFREGFRPDISVDQHSGAMCSSVPNGTPGTSTRWRSDDDTFAYPGGHAVTGSISRDT
ncbi:MAG: hypothetical protein JOZ46_04945, partial [Candidatus Dormibacteraeota bacterium]|nr:hypothetical protein [Candidatus Dormibacteraeota bacterium]